MLVAKVQELTPSEADAVFLGSGSLMVVGYRLLYQSSGGLMSAVRPAIPSSTLKEKDFRSKACHYILGSISVYLKYSLLVRIMSQFM